MRILYTNFHPRNGGGHATYVVNLARCFQGAHQVTVATPGTSRLYVQAGRIPGVRCVAASFSTRPAPMLAEVAHLRRLLREGDFDLVHVNGSADHRQAMLARLGLRRPPRIVWTKHNTMPVQGFGHWLRARCATEGAIGVSEFVTAMLRRSAYRHRPLRAIHHGVDAERFRPWAPADAREARRALLGETPADVLVLASVGGTDRDKGWLVLAQALARLPQQQRRRVRVLVAGDVPRGRLQQDFQALGLDGLVVFPGLVNDPERILAAADAGFVLSFHEACSFAACESLAMGLPTLVSDVGGLPEVVRHGVDGWIVPAGDVDAAEAWLRERLSQPIPAGMPAAARARAQESFSMQVFARRTLEFYRQVCAQD
ncbi:glycosyltransferase [Castellaniella defragrans]|jgi:glycosyltransferase involved in cell wall biosynthesis|uniref:Putative transferase n=1 Tax=Castellaniella defragrans (strain DSM 12143 / CCUG 39792 / 65Phen) TaxID=1437824 RepID=W8X9J1_CASD6|nr:glycosyltransferase [Castellaniella defragrans]CDM24915.1 putative transferase [Castellaniella defragrans 65Phen]